MKYFIYILYIYYVYTYQKLEAESILQKQDSKFSYRFL